MPPSLTQSSQHRRQSLHDRNCHMNMKHHNYSFGLTSISLFVGSGLWLNKYLSCVILTKNCLSCKIFVFFLHISHLPYRIWLYYTLKKLHEKYQGPLPQFFNVISFSCCQQFTEGIVFKILFHQVITFTDFSVVLNSEKHFLTIFSYIVYDPCKYSF